MKAVFTLLTVSFLSGTALAEEVFVQLDCKKPSSSPLQRKFLIADKKDIEFNQFGVTVLGIQIASERIQLTNPKCGYDYIANECHTVVNPIESGLPTFETVCKKVKKKRTHNGVRLERENASVMMNCDRESVLKIINEKAAFISAMGGFNVDSPECVVDGI